MHVYRLFDLTKFEDSDGIIVDMIYDMDEKGPMVRDVVCYNIVNNVVKEKHDNINPMIKLFYAANFMKLIELENKQ